MLASYVAHGKTQKGDVVVAVHVVMSQCSLLTLATACALSCRIQNSEHCVFVCELYAHNLSLWKITMVNAQPYHSGNTHAARQSSPHQMRAMLGTQHSADNVKYTQYTQMKTALNRIQ